jgi:hypothetical protein
MSKSSAPSPKPETTDTTPRHLVRVVPHWVNRHILDTLDSLFLEPVPAPENLAAPDPGMGARSVGLGVAVGVSVAAEAAIEGAGIIARGIARLFS